MCLGIPGQIVAITDPARKLAKVDVSGVKREINVACVCQDDAPLSDLLGAWVLVHVGFAMTRIDEREAQRTLELLAELGAAQEELQAMAEAAQRSGSDQPSGPH